MSPAPSAEEQIHEAMIRLEKIERAQFMSERNQSDVAKSLTSIVEDHGKTKDVLDEMKTDREVRFERDIRLNERLDRIEKSLNRVYNLGWWLLTAAGSALLLAVAKFIFSGGLAIG